MSQRYKIGLVGAGARGETFARQLHQGTPRAELHSICDIDAHRLEQFCEYCDMPNARRFTDVTEFLASPALDGVVVTTPEFTHAAVAIQAMRAGKHVYIEKPLAHTIEDCHRIIDAQRETQATVYVGFNLRAMPARAKLRRIVRSGVIGQVLHIQGIEQLSQAHGASFMRRFHRNSSNSGGVLNHKCSHDLDIMLWTIGHEHRITRVASFGGTNVFTADKQPASYCHQCPDEIASACAYQDRAGFVFPVHGERPIHHPDKNRYGADLCVYNPDKDAVDNQTVILEWDNGVRGTFVLQMYQARGARETRVWGEKGYVELSGFHNSKLRVVTSDNGDTAEYSFSEREGGHGGTDPMMIDRFLDAIEGKGCVDSGLQAGLAATLIARKSDEARLSGQVIEIPPDAWYDAPLGRATAGVDSSKHL